MMKGTTMSMREGQQVKAKRKSYTMDDYSRTCREDRDKLHAWLKKLGQPMTVRVDFTDDGPVLTTRTWIEGTFDEDAEFTNVLVPVDPSYDPFPIEEW